MLRTLAIIFGLLFVAAGILGFLPSFTPDLNLFGLFHVNAVHNAIHIVTGLIALWVGYVSIRASRLYFQIFGIIYGIFAVLGFIHGERPILKLVANNWADGWLHLLICVAFLYLGFGYTSNNPKKAL